MADVEPQLAESPEPLTPNSPTTGTIPLDQPVKLKGRQRLFQSLQRISSSPSLAKVGRTRSSEYRSGAKGSLSCVSLSSPMTELSYTPTSFYPPQFSPGYSTAPTSPGSPAVNGSSYFDAKTRIREGYIPESGTITLPADVRPTSRGLAAVEEVLAKPYPRRPNFDFWKDMPHEIKVEIFQWLTPKEIIKCSSVSKAFHDMCFDGQLWTDLDCQGYYQQITSDALVKIILNAGSFVRNLNLRGCVQLQSRWRSLDAKMGTHECRNLESFSIEGCKLDRSSIHFFLYRNPRLVHINMPSTDNINNATMKIIAHNCPHLEFLNIDYCKGVDSKGVKKVVQACPKLNDLRACELKGLDDESFMLELFERNTLERLILSHCDTLTDGAFKALLQGEDPEFDVLTERAIVPPRKLRHLDISKCRALTDDGVKALAFNVPYLEGLRLCQNTALTDDALIHLFESGPPLTHLEMEELDNITNTSMQTLARSPAVDCLRHLSISYCEQLGDIGLLPLLKATPNITSLVLDNTRVSDLVLMEIADMVRRRGSTEKRSSKPKKGLSLICFDCQNVTWAGVREVLNKNSFVTQARGVSRFAPPKATPVVSIQENDVSHPSSSSSSTSSVNDVNPNKTPTPIPFPVMPLPRLLYPTHYTNLRCFYGWQMTVDEHTKRVLRGNWSAASRLEVKWANWMIANEEMGAGNSIGGVGGRRRRRRARDAERAFLEDEDGFDGDGGQGGIGGGGARNRRRARSGGGCTVM